MQTQLLKYRPLKKDERKIYVQINTQIYKGHIYINIFRIFQSWGKKTPSHKIYMNITYTPI